MGQPIVRIEFSARDFDKLKHFYGELFGWEIDEPNEFNWANISTGTERGAQAALVHAPDKPVPPPEGAAFFFVEVDDLQATLDKAERLGGKTVVEPWDEVGIAVFVDPEGNRVGIQRGRPA